MENPIRIAHPERADKAAPSRGRNPWIAGISSYLTPGLGQIYNGQGRKGIAFMILCEAWAVGCVVALVRAPESRFLLTAVVGNAVGLLLRLISIIEAALSARRSDPDYTPKRYNHPGLYLTLFLVVTMLETGMHVTRRKLWFEIYALSIPGMTPTVMAGDQYYVRKGDPGPLHRGELVLFQSPRGTQVADLKRVIGLPGDQLEIEGRTVRVNGKALPLAPAAENPAFPDQEVLEETTEGGKHLVLYRTHPRGESEPQPFEVPPNTIFVLGDNRDHTADSRTFGPVPLANLIGKPMLIWFSFDSTTRKVRWDRINHPLR